MEHDCLIMIVELTSLVASQHSSCLKQGKAVPEMMVSLIMPFLKFISEQQSVLTRELNPSLNFQRLLSTLKDKIVDLFSKHILIEASLENQDDYVIKDIFNAYLNLQSGLLKG